MMKRLIIAAVAALALGACSDTQQAADDLKDAKEDVAEQRADVEKASDKLGEEAKELTEAEAEAAKARAQLKSEIRKDTAVRNPR